ncbi:methyl-accepting chemotaxis protein [Pelagicoccus albus]|uniref:Methyl-accepting transducer domain-containing protein n=1 Tax=Pelagicoccus albus TaxID=415222 RepID=A0A7X1B5F5_9BACT|nr:methyl-accepting chemotaxis protein [Pelagicoccus albus]MBC2605852.1 hypothetical protein [Pelagicoccus albus]
MISNLRNALDRVSFAKKLVVLLAFSLCVLLSLNAVLIRSEVRHSFEQNLDQNISKLTNTFLNQIDSEAHSALGHASLFARDESVLLAYAEASLGNNGVAVDPHTQAARQQLKEYFKSKTEGFESYAGNPYQLHFHLPTARSLWRVFRPKQNECDDISSFRHTIKRIDQGSHEPVTGIEIGRGGFAIRGIVPIIDSEKRFLGSVEYLGDFTSIFESLAKEPSRDLAVLMVSDYLSIATKLQDQNKHPRTGKFTFVNSTNKDYFSKALTPALLEKALESPQSFTFDEHRLRATAILDFKGQPVGLFIASESMEQLHALNAEINGTVILVTLSGIVAGAIGILIVLATVRRIIKTAGELQKSSKSITDWTSRVQELSCHIADDANTLAASVEETSASVTEMESSINTNAKNAFEAREIAMAALDATESGKCSMTEMSDAMKEIVTSSESVTRIVSTIDEIAFQTNILALNASVEAARAGQAGAGFAVVADEVRNLAKRSADAAAETNQQISEAVQRSNRGSLICENVLKSFSGIAAHTQRMVELVSSVSEVANEESNGASQISNAMSQLERVTQNAAHYAEGTTETANGLNSEARCLVEAAQELCKIVSGNQLECEKQDDENKQSKNASSLQNPKRISSSTMETSWN